LRELGALNNQSELRLLTSFLITFVSIQHTEDATVHLPLIPDEETASRPQKGGGAKTVKGRYFRLQLLVLSKYLPFLSY